MTISAFFRGDVDALLDEAVQEQDEAKRKEIYAEIQKILAEEVPCVYIQSLSKFYGLNDKVENFDREKSARRFLMHKSAISL